MDGLRSPRRPFQVLQLNKTSGYHFHISTEINEKAAKVSILLPRMSTTLGAMGWYFPVKHVRGETYPNVPAVMNTTHRCPKFKVNVYTTMPTRVMIYTTRVVSLQAETKQLNHILLPLIESFTHLFIHLFIHSTSIYWTLVVCQVLCSVCWDICSHRAFCPRGGWTLNQ